MRITASRCTPEWNIQRLSCHIYKSRCTNRGPCSSLLINRRDLFALTASSGLVFDSRGTTPLSKASASTNTSTSISTIPMPPTELDANGVVRLQLLKQGWNTWTWRSHKVNWLSAGENNGPIVVLVHGFGASVYHWRYLVPQLAQHCRVFALDVLGFGWSDKALVDYDGYTVWQDQISDFIKQVVRQQQGISASDKVVLVGNSLGGYNSLATAAYHPELVQGIVLLNAAGRFDTSVTSDDEPAAPAADAAAAASSQQSILKQVSEAVSSAVKRAVISASFIFAKQPLRIRQVLRQVYVDDANIDDELVESIMIPANSSNNASEVFYRVITARGTPVNVLLDKLENKMPLLLLWGSKDPWCVPARATQIQQHYPLSERIDIESGHCPHDDTPQLVVGPLLEWVQRL